MFEILKAADIRRILALALLIRLLIMPFYFHPDIKTFNFQASFLKKGVFNIYDYLSSHKADLPLKDEFVYFPLTYYFLGTYQLVASPFLGPGFEKWLLNAGTNSSLDIGVFRYLFILKLPYLILDILIGIFLTKLFSDLQTKKRILTLWLLNPFSIVLIYIYSNVDIFPVFLIVMSLYFAAKNNFLVSSLMLGLGAGFKAFPLLLIPFLLLKASTIKDKLVSSIIPTFVFLLTILPFIKSASFKESALASGLTTRIISSGLSLGFGEILMPAIILLSVLFFWGLTQTRVELWRFYLVAFIFILISIHFHLQWFLWLLPLLAISYAIDSNQEKKLMMAFILTAFAIPLLYTDKFMTVGLLKGISPLYELMLTPSDILSKVYKVETIQGVLHSALFGLGLLLGLKVIKR